MRTVEGHIKDKIADFFEGETGLRPYQMFFERSHRGKSWTNIRLKLPKELYRFSTRKEFVLPVQDAMIDGICNGAFPMEILKMVLGGAFHKSGFYHGTQAVAEKDSTLY